MHSAKKFVEVCFKHLTERMLQAVNYWVPLTAKNVPAALIKIYLSHSGNFLLLQTNVMNNNNKYYLIQLLEDNRAKKHYVWQRWGRGNNLSIYC